MKTRSFNFLTIVAVVIILFAGCVASPNIVGSECRKDGIDIFFEGVGIFVLTISAIFLFPGVFIHLDDLLSKDWGRVEFAKQVLKPFVYMFIFGVLMVGIGMIIGLLYHLPLC